MLLTNKAKKDFLKWLYSEYDYQDISVLYPENLAYTLIIEWFDSVGLFIDVIWSFEHFEYTVHYNNERSCEYVPCNNRISATKQAIIHANELYNNRNNTTD